VTAHETFLAALSSRFGRASFRAGMPPRPSAVFPARHAEVGEVRIWAPVIASHLTARLAIGAVLDDEFHDFDTHLPVARRLARLTRDVIRFLDHLFEDRLLFWTSPDHGRGGWRERTEAPYTDPLVMDNCLYRTYLWSGPLGEWRASDGILSRGQVRDDRDYQILLSAMQASGRCAIGEADRGRVEQLLAAYEREQAGHGDG
jgi:hypothetical protein